MLRDVLVGEVPTVLRGGLYAIPALVGAAIVVVAFKAGARTLVFPMVGAAVCFAMRMTGLRYGLGLPSAAGVAVTHVPRLRRESHAQAGDEVRDHEQPSGDRQRREPEAH
jgi:hypothetical protein